MKKKVLIVSTNIFGGAGNVAWQITEGLKERFQIHILTVGERRYDEVKQGVTIHYIKRRYPLSLFYSTIGKKYIDEIIREHEFDLINTHLVLPWGYIFRKYPVKKIITDHFISFYIDKRAWFFDLIEKYAVRTSLHHASSVTSVSKVVCEKLGEDYGINVRHIPNGIDLNRFHVDNSNEEKNVILFVGRFLEMKGIKYLLQAAGELPEYEFWFAGRGPMDSIIKGKNVKNIGFVEKPEELIRRATLCVFPSFNETSPLVGLEAMACGKPVIATKYGFSEYIEHEKDGIIIEPRSSEAIVDSITHLMSDKDLRREMAVNARKKADNYSLEMVCEQYADLFLEVIDG